MHKIRRVEYFCMYENDASGVVQHDPEKHASHFDAGVLRSFPKRSFSRR
jgi:hypothetical protein